MNNEDGFGLDDARLIEGPPAATEVLLAGEGRNASVDHADGTPEPERRPELIHRPGIAKFLTYSLGRSLPERNSTWVLHDVTCRTWVLRHLARTMLIVVPLFVAYMSLMPSSLGVRLLTGSTFVGAVVVFSLVNVSVDTDRRAVRAGYGFSLPSKIRSQRSSERQRIAVHLRRERIAERRERRQGRH